MHRQRLALVIAAGVGLVSIFLPWFTCGIDVSVSGVETPYGWAIGGGVRRLRGPRVQGRPAGGSRIRGS